MCPGPRRHGYHQAEAIELTKLGSWTSVFERCGSKASLFGSSELSMVFWAAGKLTLILQAQILTAHKPDLRARKQFTALSAGIKVIR